MVLVLQELEFAGNFSDTINRERLNVSNTNSSRENILNQKYEKYLDFVVNKIAEQKICHVENFMDFEPIRIALRKRGFLEACSHPWHTVVPFKSLLEKADTNNEYEKALISYILGKYPPDYMFVTPSNVYNSCEKVRVLSMLKFNDTNFGLKVCIFT